MRHWCYHVFKDFPFHLHRIQLPHAPVHPPARLSVRSSVRPSFRPFIPPSDRPTVCLPAVCPSDRPSDRLSVRPSVLPSVRPPSVRPPTRPSDQSSVRETERTAWLPNSASKVRCDHPDSQLLSLQRALGGPKGRPLETAVLLEAFPGTVPGTVVVAGTFPGTVQTLCGLLFVRTPSVL